MAKWFIRDESNQEQGPFTAGEIRRKVDAGEVQAHTMMRKDCNEKYLAAKSYKGLIKDADRQSRPDPLLDTRPTVADKRDDNATGGNTTMPTQADPDPRLRDENNPLVETRDTERLAAISGNTSQDITRKTTPQQNPDTVRTELLKTDATRMAFGRSGLPSWLKRLSIAYACCGVVALITFIIIAVSVS